MSEEFELNRLEFIILDTLYGFGSMDKFHGMTITEILEDNNGALGARMTVYKKMKKLKSDNKKVKIRRCFYLNDNV